MGWPVPSCLSPLVLFSNKYHLQIFFLQSLVLSGMEEGQDQSHLSPSYQELRICQKETEE